MRISFYLITLSLTFSAIISSAETINPNASINVAPNNLITNVELPSDQVQTLPPTATTHTDDADLEPGFPVSAIHNGGSYHAGQAIHTLVMNLDDDPELEIIATALATGPVYAWNHDGTIVPGWPITGDGAGYIAGGMIAADNKPGLAVGFWNGQIAVYDASATMQPGWPVNASNYIATPPSIANAASLTQDQIFIEEEDGALHGYTAEGQVMSGWPASGTGGQERHTPAIGDIDGDNELEILSCSSATTPGVFLHAYNADGSVVPGFPVNIDPQGYGPSDAFPVIGQIDDDSEVEILVANKRNEVRVFSGSGFLKYVLSYTGTFYYSTAIALADFDGDGQAEVVVQTNDYLNVLRFDGTQYPGFPVALGNYLYLGNSAPVIGDIDGDGSLDIVLTVEESGSGNDGQLRAYHSDGTLVSGFPKTLPIGSGAVPAIADIDLDGRNEIIVTGSYWDGYSGFYPKCWVFDLQGENYGDIAWGQFMHDAAHTGNLADQEISPVTTEELAWRSGVGSITVSPNPGSGNMSIYLRRPEETTSPILIYDLAGRLVKSLTNGSEIVWDGCDQSGKMVPVGVYFLRSGKMQGRAVIVR